MFGKSRSRAPNDLLSERMRRAIERGVAPPPTSYPLARRIERAVRQAVFRQGALMLYDGERLAVAVKDISSGGARIEFFVRRELPELVILVEPTLRIKSCARVVWQREGVAGLAFLAET
jgi:hypothetical protein